MKTVARIIIVTIGLGISAMAATTTSTTAVKPTDCQASDKSASRPVEIENIEIEADQLNQAPAQGQSVEDEQDNEQDDSFFGKPGSTKRLYWYIGGGITVAVSIALLIHYLRNNADNAPTTPATPTSTTPAIPVAQPQGQIAPQTATQPTTGPTPLPAQTTRPADNTFELGFRFAQNGCPLNEHQKQEFRQCIADLIINNPEMHNQMEDAVAYFMQQHHIQRPNTDFCEIGIRRVQGDTDITQLRGFGRGRYYGRRPTITA